MKPFTLDTVLNYRKRIENLAQHTLNKAREEQKAAEHVLLQLQTNLNQLINSLEQKQHTGISVPDLILYEDRIAVVSAETTEQKETVTRKQQQVDKEREHLLTRSKEKKVLEKLKEKQDASWKQYLNKKEAAMLDEVAVIFHDR